MTGRKGTTRLRALARLHRIQTSYFNVSGQQVHASEPTLRALLTALGVPALTDADCEESWHAALRRQQTRPVENVMIAWDGLLSSVDVQCSGSAGDSLPALHVVLEDGTILHVDAGRCRVEELAGSRLGRNRSRQIRLHTGLRLPTGYHTLVCTADDRQSSSLLIAAPTRCYDGEPGQSRLWGLFAPLYALRSDTDCGAGSYGELLSLSHYVAREGGHLAGTLPLLPCYYEAGSEPSPYLPITRLLWSEFYIDLDHIPFLNESPSALDILSGNNLARSRATLRRNPQVDYVEVERLKTAALRAAHRRLASSDAFQSSLQTFLSAQPHASRYAAFRATRDKLQTSWQQWPLEARTGNLSAAHYDEEDRRFREFEQWLAHEQMSRCVEQSSAQGVGLYLDLPVGVHPDGYDTWQFHGSFVEHAATGAPPDSVFTTGQRWGSPPLHPMAIRERRYDYVRAYLEHHMRSARMLRVDHVMGLHHIFCIPEGAEPSTGAYLRYHPDEWYALLSLESHRHKTIVVGEDLGLVPQEVRRAMARHGLSRMFVLHYEMDGLAQGHSPSIPANCLASLNTHDMPPFAAMWQGLDICQQARVGILERRLVASSVRRRRKAIRYLLGILKAVCPELVDTQGLDVVLRCTLGWLGASRARFVMVNLEDLWLETTQQNIPGVGDAHPSWRHRAARTMEDIIQGRASGNALQLLQEGIRNARRRIGGG